MAYVEFDGALDDEKSSGFVEFTGELDSPDGGQRPLLPKDTESGVGKLIGDSLSGGLDVLQETLPRPIASTIAALRGKAVAGRGASVLEGKKLEEPAYDESELTRLSNRAAAEASDPKNPKKNAPSISAPTGRLVTASDDGIIGRASGLISAQGRQTTAGALQLGSDVAGAVGLDSVSSTLGQAASGSSDIAKDLQRSVSMRAEQGGALDKYAPQVLAQLPQIGVAMLSGGITLPSVLSGLSSYAEARERGIDPVKAFQFAGGMGVAEAIGEKLGGTGKVVDAFESAFKNGFNRSAIANLSGSMLAAGVREVPSEEVTYGLQYGLESNYGVNPNPTTEGFLGGAKDTAIVSAGAGAAMGGAGAIGALATKPRSPQEAAARALSDALSGGSFDPAATTRAADSIFGTMSVDGSGVNRTGAALVEAERAKLNAMRTTAAADLSAAPDVDSAIASAERMVSVPATGPVESAVKAAQTQAATDAAVASNPVSVNKDALLSNAYAAAGITDTASGATNDAGAATPVQGAAEGRTQLDTAGVPGAPASGEQSQRTTAPALNRVGYVVNLTGDGNAAPQLQNLPASGETVRSIDGGNRSDGTQVPVRVDAGESGRVDGLRAAIERGNQQLALANERRKLRGEQPDPNTPRLNPASDEDSRAVLSIGRLLTERFGGPQYAVVPYADNRPGSANGFEIGGQAFVNVGTPSRNVASTSLHEWHHTIQRLAEYDIRRGISDSPAIRYVDQVDALFDSMSPAGKTAYISNFLRKAEIDALKRSMAGQDQAAINVAVNKLIRDTLRSEELRKEMVADFVGNRATDKDFINSLAEADPKGFKAFAQQWLKIIDGLIKKLTGNGKRGESDKVDEYLSDLNEAKRVLREAMVRYSSDRQADAAAQDEGGDAQYSRGVVAEVAPNPDQTDVKTSWDEMTPQEREQATKAVANKTVQRISDMLGLRGWSFTLSSGKYEGDINPNILIEAPQSATVEQLDEFAKALGYVLDQKAMVAFDEENTTSESQAGFVKVVLPRQMSTKEVDSLRKFIAEKVPQADGDTLREGALVFGNFSGYNDKVETLTDEQYGDAIAAAVAEFGWTGEEIKVSEPQRYHSNLIWPDNRDGYLKGTRYGEGGEIQDGAERDDVRGRQGRDLAQLREVAKDAIALRDRWIGARAAARGRGAGDSQAANGAREVGSPEREYGTAREGAVSAVGVHFSKERRSLITSSSFGSGLKGLERERLTDPANSDIKPRINFYASNGRGVIPEAGVGGITHTVKLNNLYPVKADPLKLVKNMKGATPAKRASYFERSVMKAGFDGYLDNNTGGSQDFAVLIGKHDIEMPRYSRDFVESPDDINDLGAFNIDTFDFDAKTDEKIDGDSMADIASELADAGYGVSGVVASKPTDWKQVPDKAIKGITPEAAFPMPEFAENEYGNLTAPVYAGGNQVRLELQSFGLADENLWTAFTGGLRIDADWGTPLSMRGASRKEASDYLHRMAAAKELTYRGFDFYKSVPTKSAKRIGEFWSAVPDIPGATEFAAGTPEVDGNSTEKLRQVAQARLVGKGYSVQVDSTKDFFFLQFRNKATGEIDEASIQLVGRPRGVDQQSVVLHAVTLNKGSGVGKMFYSIANTWANVVGVKVLADPDGLTAVNSVRRTENALSAAARTKGEALLEPGWAQRVYGFDGKAKTPDAKRKNLTRIALAQARNVYELAPDFEGVRYDLDTQSFVNEDGSNADAKVKGIMSRSEVRRFSLGRTSFIRAALTNELVDGEIALPEEMGEPIMYSRAQLDSYMEGRNKTMPTISGAAAQEADISLAVQAIEAVRVEIENGKRDSLPIPIGRTPHVLNMLGARQKMLRIDTGILRKVLFDKHSEDFADVTPERFVRSIYMPAMVLRGRAVNEYEIVTSIVTPRGPIMVPVTDSGNSFAVMSAYAKNVGGGGESLVNRIKGGALLYADPAMAQVAATGRESAPVRGIITSGAQFPSAPPQSAQNSNVSQKDIQVKPLNPYYVGWDKLRDDIIGGISSRKVKSDVDLMRRIGNQFKGDWEDAPSFSRSQTETPEFKRWFGDWEIARINETVNEQIDAWARREMKSSDMIQLGRPSEVLIQFGVPDLPIYLTQRILAKAVLKKHEVDVADLKDLALNVQAPIAVFGSKRGDGHRVLVTEARHADGNVIVVLELEATRDGLEVNDITSIHPKRDESVSRWMDDGLLMGYEKEKGRRWLENSAGSNSQQPQAKTALDAAIVYQTEKLRNSSKVVDADGKPLVVYHGTRADVTRFDINAPRNMAAFRDAQGFYFTSYPEDASAYTEDKDGDPADGANVMPVYLKMVNPLRVESGDVDSHPAYISEARRKRLEADGYDGIIYAGGLEFVVFRPEQIKSAIGNQGAFDPENPDIRYSRAQPYAGQNFAMPGESLLSQQRRIFQDYFLPVLEVQEALTNQGGVMSEATDVYRAEERMYGRVEETLRDFRQKWFDPMIEKAQANDITMDELSLYAYAKHAKERNAHIQRLRSDMPDNGSGMSNDEADDILTMFNVNGQTAILEDLHGDLMAITAATRREMLDTDLITQDEYDQMDSMFSNYVPLRGFEDVDLDGSKRPIRGGGKGFNIRGKETVRALGRRTRAGNIIENIVIDYEKAVFRGERNFVGQVFLNMIQQNPDPKLWEIDAERTRTAYDRQTGRVAKTREIDKGEDTIAVKIRGREVYVKIYDERLLRAMRKASKDETGQIERFVNATFGQFNSLIRSTLTQYNPIFAFVNAARDVQSGGVAVLDELGAKGVALYAKHYRAALASAGRHQLGRLDANGVAGTFFGDPTMDRYFEEYRAAGGTTGGYYGKSAEDVQQEIRNVLLAAGASPKNLMERVKTFGGSGAGRKVMRGVQSTGKVLEFLGATSENAARVAAYRAAREMGRSPAESASIAKNLTTNFNRKGEWGQVLNGMFLFFNAAIQGSHRVLKALKRGRVQGLMAGLTAAGMSSVALALAVGGDDEDDGQAYWDKIPAFEKERNFIIMLPPGAEMDGVEKVGSNGRYLKIPMPYGFNVFPAIGVQIADAVRHQQDETRGVTIGRATTNIVNAIMGSFNPLGGAIDPSSGTSMMMAALPTAFDLGLQLSEGVDSFNRPTSPYKSEFDLDPDSENVNARQAGGVFHMIARGMNRATGGDDASAGAIDVAPGTLENLWKNLTGGTGTFLSDVFVNLPTKLAQPEAEVTPRDIPLLRNFYGMVDGVNDSSLLYERRREILRAKTEEKNRADKEMEPSSDPMEIALASLAKLSNQYTKQISALRKEEIALAQDAEMSTAEKNIRRKEIKMQRDELAREFNAAYMETMRSKRDGDFDAE